MVLIAAVMLMGVVQAADTFVADRCVFLHGLGVKGATDLLFMDVSDITFVSPFTSCPSCPILVCHDPRSMTWQAYNHCKA